MRIRTLSIIALLMLLYPSAARAGAITIESDFVGVNVHFVFDGTTYQPIVLGSVPMSGGSGLGPALDAPATFDAYCADLLTDVFGSFAGLPDPPATYNADAALMSDWADPNGLTSKSFAGNQAAWLYNTYAATFGSTQFAERTALQMAIWNTLYDTDFDVAVDAGRFFVTDGYADVATLANTYLKALEDNVAIANLTNATWLQLSYTNPDTGEKADAQDFIGPLASTTPVPEPGAGLLLVTGLLSVASFRSRRARLGRG